MIDRTALVDDTIRLIVPNMVTLSVLPPGTILEVTGHIPEQPSSCYVRVVSVPEQPTEYNIVVPKGAKVTVHER